MRQFVKYGTAGLSLMLLLSTQPARADVEVLESSVPAIKAGARLKDSAILALPSGATLRVLIKTDGTISTKTLKGPYEGTVADYKDAPSWWERLTGRTKDPETPMGATRGIGPMH